MVLASPEKEKHLASCRWRRTDLVLLEGRILAFLRQKTMCLFFRSMMCLCFPLIQRNCVDGRVVRSRGLQWRSSSLMNRRSWCDSCKCRGNQVANNSCLQFLGLSCQNLTTSARSECVLRNVVVVDTGL